MRKSLVLFGLVAAVACSLAQAETKKLQLVSVTGPQQISDLGEKGDSPGDILTFTSTIKDAKAEAIVGQDQGYCFRISPAAHTWECAFSVVLKNGSINVAGTYNDAGDSTFAVVGGTGVYHSARGVLKVHPRDPKVESELFTFELE
jgi:Dirigent-like protein